MIIFKTVQERITATAKPCTFNTFDHHPIKHNIVIEPWRTDMSLEIKRDDNVLVLRGLIDGYTIDQLAEVLKEDHSWTLDMVGVSFMASCGLGLLIKRHFDLAGRGMTLTIRKPSKAVRTALEVTKLIQLFKLED